MITIEFRHDQVFSKGGLEGNRCLVGLLHRMDSVVKALEEVLTAALPQGCITVGVYEAAKSLNV